MDSAPFGAHPADEEMAAFGCGVAGVLLGVILPDAFALASGRPVQASFSRPLWLALVFACGALLTATWVRSWALRIALLAFAAAQMLASMRPSFAGPAVLLSLHAVIATGVLIASWPNSTRLARAVSVLLFVAALVFKLAARRSMFGVFG